MTRADKQEKREAIERGREASKREILREDFTCGRDVFYHAREKEGSKRKRIRGSAEEFMLLHAQEGRENRGSRDGGR